MALIIAGHQRSGTSLLQVLCNHHRAIEITMEFGNFMRVGKSYAEYARHMIGRWSRRAKRAESISSTSFDRQWRTKLGNHAFFARYLVTVFRHRMRSGIIDRTCIEAALKCMFRKAQIVGDKYPDYVFRLDELAGMQGLLLLVIYRDCRDVVSSTLQKVRTDWRTMRQFVQAVDTAEKVARRWALAIDSMERHADQLHIMRYEDLVRNPKAVLASLGNWLCVDPDGFPSDWVKMTSIGKYKNGLSGEELATVMDIAGPAMARLGYV